MKLRNKKTGEIGYLIVGRGSDNYHVCNDEWYNRGEYYSLTELNKEWEDYEEPKAYWYIDPDGEPICEPNDDGRKFDNECKQIGNYFGYKEEAEKAVEKLKAWKRLKDKGFRFDGYDAGHNYNKELCGQAYFKAGNFWFDIKADLHLLFGGEE